jgi:hypothetical protein
MAGAIAGQLYRSQDAPKYLLGHGLEMMFVVMGLVAVVVLRISYGRINAKRERMEVSENAYSDKELSDMGDRAPTFRYMM